MKSLLSINHIFGLFTLGGMLLLSLFFGGLMLGGFNQVFDHHVKRTMDARLTGFARQLNDYVKLHDVVLSDLASNPLVVQGIMQPETAMPNTVDYLELVRMMGEKRRLMLYAFDGQLLHDTARKKKRPLLNDTLVQKLLMTRSRRIWRFQSHAEHGSYLLLAVPVRWGGVPEGVLAAEIPLQAVPLLNRHRSQGGKDAIELFKDGQRIFGAEDKVEGRQAQLYMPALGLTLRYTANLDEIDHERDLLLKRIQMIGLAALLLSGTGVFWMGRTLFVRPLQRLEERTTRLAEGEKLEVSGRQRRRLMVRELQDLTDKFDVMAQEVGSARSSLEEKVHERTAQLERELDERHKTENRLRHVLTLQTAILDSANSSIISTDRYGIIQTFNKGAERMLGFTADEVVGLRTPEILHDTNELRQHAFQLSRELDKRIEPGVDALFAKARMGMADEREWQILRQDGSQVPVLITVTPIHNESGLLVGFLAIGTEISLRKRLEAELKEANWRLQRALDSAQAGTFYYEVADDALDWDERSLEIFGLTTVSFSQNYEGWAKTLLPDELTRAGQELEQLLDNPKQETLDLHYAITRQNDGQQRIIRAQGWIHRNDQDKATHISGLHLDITEEIRAQEALEEARRAAEEANQAKSDFLASMSHEIRTPMNAVIGLSDVLQETPLNSEQKGYVATLKRASHTLLDLINAILDLSKIESGRFELMEHPFDLADMARGVCAVLRIQAEQKGLTLDLVVAEDLPSFVVGDSPRLRQILINLIGNAIKFTEQGHVKVSIMGQDEGRALWFGIEDSGVGIAPQQLEHIFDKFTQADSSLVRRFAGSGLGLAISKQLVELMGGAIGVESRLGQGSLFYFTIPLQQGEALFDAELAEPEVMIHHPQQDPLHLLVVEDSADNRMLIQTYFKKYACNLTFAEDGQEGVDAFEGAEFDLIFMDVQMPRMDGYTATRKIRAREAELGHQPIPILALTAHALESDIKKSQEAGCNEHLTKPVKKQTLIAAIERHLGRTLERMAPSTN
ncbi:ATP-binding protein [Magnetococcus sp. PR-3]|uniref:ATP-binding protein n=1 Tax=Magnetococcus sp. PR-3 TaxID=3120355 RepID=UPI002FCE443B